MCCIPFANANLANPNLATAHLANPNLATAHLGDTNLATPSLAAVKLTTTNLADVADPDSATESGPCMAMLILSVLLHSKQ